MWLLVVLGEILVLLVNWRPGQGLVDFVGLGMVNSYAFAAPLVEQSPRAAAAGGRFCSPSITRAALIHPSWWRDAIVGSVS